MESGDKIAKSGHSIGKITNRHAPLIYFLLSLIFYGAFGLLQGSYCVMVGSGLLVSWVYLRQSYQI